MRSGDRGSSRAPNGAALISSLSTQVEFALMMSSQNALSNGDANATDKTKHQQEEDGLEQTFPEPEAAGSKEVKGRSKSHQCDKA